MQISEIDNKKIKIVLTNTEVLSAFSSYERLLKMDDSTKFMIKALIREIAEIKYQNNWSDLSVNIKARINQGCIMTITPTEYTNFEKTCIFEFTNIENLIKSIVSAIQNPKFKICENSLYKMQDSYRLIIDNHESNFHILNEFCDKIYRDKINQQFTYEYGKLLIENNAIQTLYNVFKDS